MFMKLNDPIATETVLIDNSESRREIFANFLTDRGLRVSHNCATISNILANTDPLIERCKLIVIYVGGGDTTFLDALQKLRGETKAAILVFTDANEVDFISELTIHGADQVVPMGLQTDRIVTGTVIALETARKRQKLTSERDKAMERLADTSSISRAKNILMERHTLSEKEAHAKIQQLSMEKNLSIPKMAHAIIEAESILCRA